MTVARWLPRVTKIRLDKECWYQGYIKKGHNIIKVGDRKMFRINAFDEAFSAAAKRNEEESKQ